MMSLVVAPSDVASLEIDTVSEVLTFEDEQPAVTRAPEMTSSEART
jgi:hypothetical protein